MPVGADVGAVGSGRDRWWDPDKNWSQQTDDIISGYLTTIPETQIGAYDQIADKGIFGESGIDYVMKGRGQETALARQRLTGGLKRRLGKRLGARAGGTAELMAANQVLAPMFEQDVAMSRDLRMKNIMSKLEGLYGRDRMLQIMTSLYQPKDDEGKAGALDWLKGLAGVGSSVAAFL